jgi:ureidoacrylate peracid hydrolase
MLGPGSLSFPEENAMTELDELLNLKQRRIEQLHCLEPGRTALLVIDMQRAFLERGATLEVPPGRALIPNLQRLIQACRQRGLLIFFTEFIYSPTVPCLRGDPFGPEHLPARAGEPTGFGMPSASCLIGPDEEHGANSADIVPELAPSPDELVVRGHTYDKFLGTPLELALRSRDVRHLIVTGVLTDVCVNCTLLSAANRDYRVTAVTDGVATLWPELQEACFTIWRRKFARLRTAEEILAELDTW